MQLLRNIIRQNKSLLLFICLLASFRGAIADWHPVPTGSMKPTILEGDVIWHNKLAYDLKLPFTNIKILKLGEPKRGDIVVVNSSSAEKRLVKRLVGLPGDEIRVIDNRLMVNGQYADYQNLADNKFQQIRPIDREPGYYLTEQVSGSAEHVIHVRSISNNQEVGHHTLVPDGHYFLMGDSRDNSADSRFYGAFPREELRGRATHILLSMNILDTYKPRVERFFSRLL